VLRNSFVCSVVLEAQTISRRVSPTDIAPTIAAYLSVKYPSSSVGTPLAEVLVGGH
jgi:hypothetical protein